MGFDGALRYVAQTAGMRCFLADPSAQQLRLMCFFVEMLTISKPPRSQLYGVFLSGNPFLAGTLAVRGRGYFSNANIFVA